MLGLYASSGPSVGLMAMEQYDQNHLCNNKPMFDVDFADSSPFSHLDHHDHHPAAEIVDDILDQSPPSTNNITDGNATIVNKKLNHNASERNRRKKMNFLYSSLRALLPASDQMKKLSNPATVSRALKYIAELQSQVKALTKKKEELVSSFSRKLDLISQERQKKSSSWRSLSAISSSRLNDREIALQISTLKVHNTPLSLILLDLEEDGFSFLTATSHESYGGRIFYTLHLQVQRSYIEWQFQ